MEPTVNPEMLRTEPQSRSEEHGPSDVHELSLNTSWQPQSANPPSNVYSFREMDCIRQMSGSLFDAQRKRLELKELELKKEQQLLDDQLEIEKFEFEIEMAQLQRSVGEVDSSTGT